MSIRDDLQAICDKCQDRYLALSPEFSIEEKSCCHGMRGRACAICGETTTNGCCSEDIDAIRQKLAANGARG